MTVTPAIETPTKDQLEVLWKMVSFAPPPPQLLKHCNHPTCLKARRPVIIPARKQSWCSALRSGTWTQVHGEWGEGSTRCAMGVLLALVGVPIIQRMDADSTLAIADWLGVNADQLNQIMQQVVQWNDIDRLSFDQIAERIERDY